MTERIGEFLLRIGALTENQLTEVIKIQDAEEDEPRLIGQIAIELGYIDDEALKRYLAEKK